MELGELAEVDIDDVRLAAHDLRLIGVADLYGMNGDGVNRLAIRK